MTGYQEPNYTQVPNELLDDDLALMGNAELRVTLAIVRKIIGYHKTAPEPISLTQIQKLTGLSRQGVIDGLGAAIKRGRIVLVDNDGVRGTARYTVNFVDQSNEQTGTSQASRPDVVYPVDTQKKRKEITKENNTRRSRQSDQDMANVATAYEQNIGMITPIISDNLNDALDHYPADWIVEAIGIAVDNNKRKWSYVAGILNNWQTNGKESRRDNGQKPPRAAPPDIIPLTADEYAAVRNRMFGLDGTE